SVHGLEHSDAVAYVGTGREAEAADQACREVGDDVAEQVFHHHDVERMRIDDELHRGRIDDTVVEFNVRKFLGHSPTCSQEQTIAELEDVSLVNARDAFAVLPAGSFECEPRDLLGRRFSHHAQTFHNAWYNLVLEA